MGRIALALVAAFLLAACGGGGGDPGGGGPSPLYVGIDPPAASTITAASVDLYGLASCDHCPASTTAFGYCPAVDPPQASGIDVRWANRATGASGPTNHAIVGHCSCLFSQCFVTYSHRWSAQVPVAFGGNDIEVNATGPGGTPGQDTVAIVRVPAAPAGLAAESGDAQVTLSWSDVTGATTYDLWYATAPGVSPTTGTRISGVSSPFVHAGLANDQAYYYTLTATAGGYAGPASEIAWATPGWQVVAVPGTALAAGWRDLALATDAAGHAHVFESLDEIPPGSGRQNQYLTNAGGAWSALAAATPSWASAGIGVDLAGDVHVGYLAAGATHAVRVSGAWVAEVVDAAGWCRSALALDAAGNPHLAYDSLATGAPLRYATRATGSWVVTDVGVAGSGGCSNSGGLALAVDAGGAAHVAWSGDYPGYGLRYATNRGGAWAAATLDPAYVTSVAVAVAVDGRGTVHVAWTDNAGQLRIATDAGGTWVAATLGSMAGPNHASLALDAAGHAWVGYLAAEGGGEVGYYTDAGGSWRQVLVSPAESAYGGDTRDAAIALDAQGRVHLVFYRDGGLRHATSR